MTTMPLKCLELISVDPSSQAFFPGLSIGPQLSNPLDPLLIY